MRLDETLDARQKDLLSNFSEFRFSCYRLFEELPAEKKANRSFPKFVPGRRVGALREVRQYVLEVYEEMNPIPVETKDADGNVTKMDETDEESSSVEKMDTTESGDEMQETKRSEDNVVDNKMEKDAEGNIVDNTMKGKKDAEGNNLEG